MKKIFFLSALLCASMASFAAKFCDVPTGHLNDANFGDASARILVTVAPTGNDNEFTLTIKPNVANGNEKKLDVLYAIIGDGGTTNPYPITAGADVTEGGEDELSATFTYTGSNDNVMTLQFSNPGWDGRWQCTVSEVNYAALVDCSAASKSNPELSLNATEKTLDAAESETFQIVANRSGDGAISYVSSNANIASVSEDGLVTAVGRGSAVITVSVAETETYEEASLKLIVTVTGPVNWDAVDWLAGGNEKYKVVTDPEIGSQFGGKHIENENLWIGFPSAVFGEDQPVQYSSVGAGVSFPLSQFPNEFNGFNFICDNVTYAITLYYVDGTKQATAVENILNAEKAVKVVENGQIVIIKNGVRFNALGQQMK